MLRLAPPLLRLAFPLLRLAGAEFLPELEATFGRELPLERLGLAEFLGAALGSAFGAELFLGSAFGPLFGFTLFPGPALLRGLESFLGAGAGAGLL